MELELTHETNQNFSSKTLITFQGMRTLYVLMPSVAVSAMSPVQNVRDLPGPYPRSIPPPPLVNL